MAIMGHNTPAMTGKYTHVGQGALTATVDSMPALPGHVPARDENEDAIRLLAAELLTGAPIDRVRRVVAMLEG